MQVCQQILAKGKKLTTFYAPVYKPAGLCSLKLREGFKLDLYFVLDHHGIRSDPLMTASSRFMEPFASGVITFIVGNQALRKKKNFVLADYIYDLTIEFGVERELACIDGQVISVANTRGLNEFKIREVLPNFEGTISQDREASYRTQQDDNRDPLQLINNPDWDAPGLGATEILNEITLAPTKKRSDRLPQKYPHVSSKRETVVKSIELIRFTEPYGEFRISSDGGFRPRRFALDLANSLGTQASVVSLNRVKEGPMEKNDLLVLQPYELNLEYYCNRLPIYKDIYDRFNSQLDPIWEDKPT